MKRSIISVAVLALVMGVVGCSKSKASTTRQVESVPIRLAKVETDSMVEPIRCIGRTAAKQEMTLSFKIGGIVERIYVEEGAKVHKGDLLATLNLSEINAQVNQAQQGVDKTNRDLERVRNLYADSVASLEQLQNVTTASELAKANLQIACFNQQYASIYAPVDGVVMKKFMNENELVGGGTPIMALNNSSKGWIVKTGLAGRDAVRLKIRDLTTVSLDAYPGVKFEGRVRTIAISASPMTGTFDVEVELDSQNMNLLSGLAAKLEIKAESSTLYRRIPLEALIEANGDKAAVYSLDATQHLARKIQIGIGPIIGQNVVVTSGLDGVEYIVEDGVSYLRDGSIVAVAAPITSSDTERFIALR